MATHCSILAWRISWTEEYWGKGNARPLRTAGRGIQTDTDSRRPSASRLRPPVRPGAWGRGSPWCQLSVCPSLSRRCRAPCDLSSPGSVLPRGPGPGSWRARPPPLDGRALLHPHPLTPGMPEEPVSPLMASTLWASVREKINRMMRQQPGPGA